jgi:putative oxidoreductase
MTTLRRIFGSAIGAQQQNFSVATVELRCGTVESGVRQSDYALPTGVFEMNRLYGDFIAGRGAWGLLVLRIIVGAGLMFHGWSKIQNPFGWMGPEGGVPGVLQALAALSEFGGGLAMILGLLTPIAALGIICTMLTAIFMVHVPNGDPFVGRGGSWELPALYFASVFAIMMLGPGKLSLDALLFKKKMEPRRAVELEHPEASIR